MFTTVRSSAFAMRLPAVWSGATSNGDRLLLVYAIGASIILGLLKSAKTCMISFTAGLTFGEPLFRASVMFDRLETYNVIEISSTSITKAEEDNILSS